MVLLNRTQAVAHCDSESLVEKGENSLKLESDEDGKVTKARRTGGKSVSPREVDRLRGVGYSKGCLRGGG